MTKEEKFTEIINRLGEKAKDFKPIHLSIIVIMGYLTTLEENGFISGGEVKVTTSGNDALSLCNEFDWTPTDSEIASFCKDMVEVNEIETILMMLLKMRDDKKSLLSSFKKNF